ncbi:hypothetical protein [Streptomyces sp. NRRL B-24572]|uniref:hypothetical protein n=1 Tax=Streptomyces sp. NRRL B-24572 TaxID=1962156 RepID=UPI000A389BBA|nr:hypothetical protein [Streptomyces sp. NRRL B-24572]
MATAPVPASLTILHGFMEDGMVETTTGSKAELCDAFAADGKALTSGKRLELLDLLDPLDSLAQCERTVDAPRDARLGDDGAAEITHAGTPVATGTG